MAIKGKLFMVGCSAGASGSSEFYRTIAYATSHTLDISSSLDSVLTKDDNEDFKKQEVTTINWSLKTENLIAADPEDEGVPTYKELVDAMKSKTKLNVRLAYHSGAAGAERKGTDWTDSSNDTTSNNILRSYAYITSLELNAENKNNVSYTATFQGAGALTE